MTATHRTLLIGFGLLGLAAASTASYVHYQLLTDASYTSFCDVNTTVSCTTAYLSPYGSFLGVPVALVGVVFFAVVLLLAGPGGRSTSPARENVAGDIFALSTLGLAFVLYLAWASYFQLKTFCALCAIAYVAAIAIFVISGRAPRVPGLFRRAARDLQGLLRSPAALVAVLVLAAGAATAIGLFPRERAVARQATVYPPLTDEQRAELGEWWAVQPTVDLPIASDGAKVLIVKFSDYMCPACRQTYEWYGPVLGKYPPGQVHYVVKDYPLEAECNPGAPGNHYASCEAAAAVIMARAKGTAPALEQWIFANQMSLTPDSVKKAARDVGRIEDFEAEYPQALQDVRADASLGTSLGIDQTPTFYINGRKLPGPNLMPPQYFDYLIELALKD